MAISSHRLLPLIAMVGIIGVALGYAGTLKFSPASLLANSCETSYAMLDVRKICNLGDNAKVQEYDAFKNSLSDWIDAEEKNGNLMQASIYFRDLKNGPWFGINDSEKIYSAASLMKLPIMMAYLKLSEDRPGILQEKIMFRGDLDNFHNLTDAQRNLKGGETYTVDQIVTEMMVYSDNDAKQVLLQHYDTLVPGQNPMFKTFTDLGILPKQNATDVDVSVSVYAAILRQLYKATYLNAEMSEKALSIMSQSIFKDGLVAGVPASIKVAHKFGIRNDDPANQQLHDCGIVYHPVTPYLLCIMTRSKSMDNNIAAIHELSHRIYQEVDSRSRNIVEHAQ